MSAPLKKEYLNSATHVALLQEAEWAHAMNRYVHESIVCPDDLWFRAHGAAEAINKDRVLLVTPYL